MTRSFSTCALCTAMSVNCRGKKQSQSKKSIKFLAIERKKLVAGVKNEEYKEVMEEAFTRLLHDHQFKYYSARFRFVEVFKAKPMKAKFLRLIKTMKATYTDILEAFCKGKKFLKFQTAWFFHVNVYFDKTFEVQGLDANRATELKRVWEVVLKLAAERDCVLPEEDQHIIVSTLSFILFELMSEKIKDKKIKEFPSATSQSHDTATVDFQESVISLYRYSGFALHSVAENHHNTSYVQVLEALRCKQTELDEVPSQIHDLNCGGQFTIISPKIIPYVKLLMQLIMLTVGEENLKVNGHEMIKIAKSNVISNSRLLEQYKKCIQSIEKDCDITFDSCSAETIRIELSQKIFNARINEFFKARKELDLETKKKVVDCDQSLRDALKTFASLKSRD